MFALASLISSLIIYRFSTPLGPILVWAVILSAIYGIDALLLRRRFHIDPQLKDLRDTLWLILLSAIVSTVLAVISVSALVNFGEVPWSQYFSASVEWWIGEMNGVLVFTPFLLIYVMPWLNNSLMEDGGNLKKPHCFPQPIASSYWTGNQHPGDIVSGLCHTSLERFPTFLFDCGTSYLDRPEKRFFKGKPCHRRDEFWNHPGNLAV